MINESLFFPNLYGDLIEDVAGLTCFEEISTDICKVISSAIDNRNNVFIINYDTIHFLSGVYLLSENNIVRIDTNVSMKEIKSNFRNGDVVVVIVFKDSNISNDDILLINEIKSKGKVIAIANEIKILNCDIEVLIKMKRENLFRFQELSFILYHIILESLRRNLNGRLQKCETS